MTNEELVVSYQDGNKQALEELIMQNKGIVNQMVNKYYSSKTNSMDRDDLVQEGYIGLMIALEKYNPNREHSTQFITYAVFWIRQRISRYVQQKNTNDEISLNIPVGDDQSMELVALLKDSTDPYLMIEERLYIQELREELENVMDNCTTLKEREIIKLKYGWDSNIELTDGEVGGIFKLTKYQVNDIRSRVFHKMRRSPWGEGIAKEKYKEKECESIQNVDKLIYRLDFAERYLIKEVDL